MIYKKLSEVDLKQIYIQLKAHFESDEDLARQLRNLVVEYFPTTSHSVLVKFESQYTDEDFFNFIVAMVVYDKHGDELEPLPGKKVDFEEDFRNCEVAHTEEPREDFAFTMVAIDLPELFSKQD